MIGNLILGSQSPRRKEILEYFSIPFEQASPHFDEEAHPCNGIPEQYAMELAEGKGISLKHRFPQQPILTADTVVWKEGKSYGKAKSREEAFTFLTELSGTWHSVYTGVALIYKDAIYKGYEETKVLFNPLTSTQIDRYLMSHPWSDKAGAYMIQSSGIIAIQKIEGCYFNVIGLPINTVRSLLLEIGVDLWNYLTEKS